MYRPKVSIVIPAYNASNYLSEAIESALAQTYENIEIIVVNDGSRDDGATAEVAKHYAEKIRYFEKENGGSSSALNCGIRHMEGEWFSWLSHDDLYYPEKVQRQIEFLESISEKGENPEGHVVFSAGELIGSSGELIYRASAKRNSILYRELEGMKNKCFLVAEAGGKYIFNGCSCLVHRSVFESVGGFDEKLRLINDADMWKRIYMAGYRIHYLPDILVKGRIHPKQVSAEIGFSYHNPEQDAYWKSLLDWLVEEDLTDEDKRSSLYLFSRCAYSKTRREEGKRAFDMVLHDTVFFKGICLRIKMRLFILKNSIRNLLKTAYRRLKMS